MKSRILVFILTIIVLVIACKKQKKEYDSYNQTALINNWADSLYLPAINEFYRSVKSIDVLVTEYALFKESSKLQEIKTEWKVASLLWRGIEPFIIGDLKNSFISYRLTTFPIDTADVKSLLNDEMLNADLLNTKPSDNVGLYCLEYLLFSIHLDKSGSYYDLLSLVSKDVLKSTERFKLISDNSIDDFLSSKGYSLSSTIGQVLNQVPVICESTLRYKIGIPIGYYDYVEMDDRMLEAWRSKTSFETINKTINTLKNVFYGVNGIGLEEYLIEKGEVELVQKADDYFNETELILSEISKPLFGQLILNETKLTALRLSFKKIRSLFIIDISPTLGFNITFSDADGD